MNLFAEIAATNRAYCASHGLSAAELYGRLSEPELERALVIDLDLARAVAEETKWLMAKGMSAAKATRWAEVNARTGVSNRPHAVIEYGRQAQALPDMNINAHMDGFGFRSGDRNWTGD